MSDYATECRFEKYHGAGNDFLLVEHPRYGPHFPDQPTRIAELCARRTGVGADGLIFWTVEPNHGARMQYYNADGQPSSFCGNGARCFVRCLHDHGLWPAGTVRTFQANDGAHTGEVLPDGRVRVSMIVEAGVTTRASGEQVVDTGSPHFLRWREVLPEGDITEEARALRYSAAFAKTGINVNFVCEAPDSTRLSPKLAIRTYERGVEEETLACGTGVTAAALGYAERHGLTGAREVDVQAVGGALRVAFSRKPDGGVSDVYLTGPAVRVYEGTYRLTPI